MGTESLLLNIIPFSPPVKEMEFAFYTKKQDGYASIHKDDLAGTLEGKVNEDELHYGQWLYTDFAEAKPNAIILKVNLMNCPHFASHYYRHLIRNYFKGVANIMGSNYTKEIEVLIKNENSDSTKYRVYNQFTLKVQYARVTDGPELVLSFDGKSKEYAKSIQEMRNFDTDKLNWVNCNGELHKYKFMPAHFKLNMDKLFPMLSNKLKPELGINFDMPDFSNRYPKYQKLLQEFYNKFLNTTAFKKIIPLSADGFFRANSTSVQRINNTTSELLYGNGTGRTPKFDFIKLKPYKAIPPPNNVKFFFIYQKNQRDKVKELYKFFMEGYKKNPDDRYPFPPMQDFICQPFQIEENASIQFDSLTDAVSTVEKAIKNKVKLPDTKYMAIYISPESRNTVSDKDRIVYYRIKEILLNEKISSQFVYVNNIGVKGYEYHLPNIEIAILAKLGGVPWRLNRSLTSELIVGVGAFRSLTHKTKYVGSAFCFNNEGNFKGFDCFGANETDMLAGSIRIAVTKFVAENYKAERLIIHFYKVMSKKELKPIMDTLHKMGLPIPVIIVSINKTESKELLGFDTSYNELMPFSGTYAKVGRNEYLLFNNTRYDSTSSVSKREFHFPVKIKISCTKEGLLDEPGIIDSFMDQVYQFSRMYWKSVSQQSLPVTIKYPEMVAEIYPYFRDERLPDFGKENLWFL